MHKVKAYTENGTNFMQTHIEIDGKRMQCSGIEYTQHAGEVPQCVLEMPCLPDLDVLANLQFQFTPQTIQEAAKVLRRSLITDSILYDAFRGSIESALREVPAGVEVSVRDLAKSIADRIIGGIK
uniref:Uncharacterized protein n=1 Tax=Dulem virus 39 TaxID=3145757 RepID=A0AAU8B9A3_9CAUD